MDGWIDRSIDRERDIDIDIDIDIYKLLKHEYELNIVASYALAGINEYI